MTKHDALETTKKTVWSNKEKDMDESDNWRHICCWMIRLKKHMKSVVIFIVACFCAFISHAQNLDTPQAEQIAEKQRRMQYKEVVTKIFKDDELFVLFYLNLALVVDPTRETQIIERITTENPWESLTDYIKGKSNIYFCPSGRQLGIAIEYMSCPIDSDILMSDRYGMYRLSSPEELFKNRGDSFRTIRHKAVVFGGLRYDEEDNYTNDNLLSFRGNREAIGGYNYLKSTYEEAIYVDSIFRRNGIETALLTGDDGTEKSFVQIPNHQVDILHIASHGFYEPNNDNAESSSLKEWMMSHSGLVLSGAEIDTDDKSNDGKLTAYEISQTDLSGVNLVVLSACDTGIGDIKENDVYGVLKGFKMAGAGTLLVTLSEVNDTVTSLLIKRFYDNIFRGDNPRRALENAQRYIRLHGNGQFNKPEHWASFILIDDLDRNVGKDIDENCQQSFLHDIISSQDIYTEDLYLPKWEQLFACMQPSDVIVNVFTYTADNMTRYIAQIGDIENSVTHVVRLFDVKDQQLGVFSVKDVLSFENYERSFEYVDSVLWHPLQPFFQRKQRVILKLGGFLNNYPCESLPSVIDKYGIYRVSSLSVLMNHTTLFSGHKIDPVVLFGGLDYDVPPELLEELCSLPFDELYKELTRNVTVGLHYLPGTKVEVDSIAGMLTSVGLKAMVMDRELGTEHAFRCLSGQPVRIIHVSTHVGSLISLNKRYESILYENRIRNTLCDYLSDTNVILFSGVNERLNGKTVPFSQNDGIIFGTDIESLDLSHVELVVLSACGSSDMYEKENCPDISFDLIRSFKKAGAKSILHSVCRSVYDRTAVILMVNFYASLLKGESPHDALESAKRMLRHSDLWHNPKYWAAFVLVDAL